jgi:hypothetical protein
MKNLLFSCIYSIAVMIGICKDQTTAFDHFITSVSDTNSETNLNPIKPRFIENLIENQSVGPNDPPTAANW